MQLLGVLAATDGPFIYNRFLELSKLDCLWAAFVMKVRSLLLDANLRRT